MIIGRRSVEKKKTLMHSRPLQQLGGSQVRLLAPVDIGHQVGVRRVVEEVTVTLGNCGLAGLGGEQLLALLSQRFGGDVQLFESTSFPSRMSRPRERDRVYVVSNVGPWTEPLIFVAVSLRNHGYDTRWASTLRDGELECIAEAARSGVDL